MATELSLEQFNSMVSAQPKDDAPETPPSGGKPGKEMSLSEFNARAAMAPKQEEPFTVHVFGHGDGKEEAGSDVGGGRGKMNPPSVDEIQPGSLADKSRNFGMGVLKEVATIGDMVIGLPAALAGDIAGQVMYADMQASGINRDGAAAASREFGQMVAEKGNPKILSNMAASLSEKMGEEPTPGLVDKAMGKLNEWIDKGAVFTDKTTGHAISADEFKMEASLLTNLLFARGLGKVGAAKAKPATPKVDGLPDTIYVDSSGTAHLERPFDPVDQQPSAPAFEVMERKYREAQNPRMLTEKELAKAMKSFNQFHDGRTTVEANRAADASHAKNVAGGADPKLLAIIGGGTAGYLLAQAYPEKATDLAVMGMALSTAGIGPPRMGDTSASLGTLLGKGRHSLSILENLNQNHSEFPIKRIQEEMRRPEVTKAEKEIFQSIVEIFHDRDKISAGELVRAIRMMTEDYILEPKDTGVYADVGLQNLGRYTESMREDIFDEHPRDVLERLDGDLAEVRRRAEAPEGTEWEDWPHTPRQAQGHIPVLEDQHATAMRNLELTKQEVDNRTTIWSTNDRINISPTTNHFSADNYFGHTRSFREDGVEHVVEIQSDLTQNMKPPTEANVMEAAKRRNDAADEFFAARAVGRQVVEKVGNGDLKDSAEIDRAAREAAERIYNATQEYTKTEQGIGPGEQAKARRIEPMFKDPFKRLSREELARAARKGDETVRFATADTVAKVEGWPRVEGGRIGARRFTPEGMIEGLRDHNEKVKYILDKIDYYKNSDPTATRKFVRDLMDEHQAWLSNEKFAGRETGTIFLEKGHDSIYNRYKGDVEKFLKKLGGKEVTDHLGHTWIEVPTGVKGGENGYFVDLGPKEGVKIFTSKAEADAAFLKDGGDGPPPMRISESHFKDPAEIEKQVREAQQRMRDIEAQSKRQGVDPQKNNAYRMAKSVMESLADDLKFAKHVQAFLPKGKPTRAQMFGGATTDAMKTLAGVAFGITIANQFNSDNPIASAILGAIVGATAAHFTAAGVKTVFSSIRNRQFGPTDTRARITGMMEDHQTDFTRMEREVAKFSGAMLKAVPKKADRERVHLAVDSGKVGQLPANLQAAAATLQKFYQNIAAEAMAAGVLDSALANYSTHLWKDVNAAKNLLAQKQKSMSPQSRFNKQRVFLTMREGIAAGLQPLTLDAAEVAAIYGRSMGRSIANAKLIDRLKRAYTPAGEPILIKASNVSKATANYETINHPQLAGKRIHPDVMSSMKFLFEAEDAGAFWEAANAVNIALKRNAVTFSLFHVKSLLEAGVVAGHPLKAGKVLLQATAPKIFGTNKFLNELRTGGAGDLVDKLLEGGLRVSFERAESVDIDVGGGFYHGMRYLQNGMDKVLPFGIGKNAVGAVMKFNHLVDNWMWGRVHAALKLEVASAKMEALMTNAGKRGKPLTEKQAARLASDYTNRVFGGLNWMRMAENMQTKWGRDIALSLVSRKGRMGMNFGLFAPDWTISTMSAFYKAAGKGSGPRGLIHPINDVDLYRQQLLRLGFYYGTALNAINLATSGHNIWENKDPTRIELADGRTMQMAKHSFEAFHAMANPGQFAMSKLGIIPKEAAEQALGVEYLSAKGRMPPMQNRAQHALKNFAPIGVQQFQQGPQEGVAGMLGAPIYGQTKEQAQKAAKERRLLEYKKRRQKYLESHQQKGGQQ